MPISHTSLSTNSCNMNFVGLLPIHYLCPSLVSVRKEVFQTFFCKLQNVKEEARPRLRQREREKVGDRARAIILDEPVLREPLPGVHSSSLRQPFSSNVTTCYCPTTDTIPVQHLLHFYSKRKKWGKKETWSLIMSFFSQTLKFNKVSREKDKKDLSCH